MVCVVRSKKGPLELRLSVGGKLSPKHRDGLHCLSLFTISYRGSTISKRHTVATSWKNLLVPPHKSIHQRLRMCLPAHLPVIPLPPCRPVGPQPPIPRMVVSFTGMLPRRLLLGPIPMLAQPTTLKTRKILLLHGRRHNHHPAQPLPTRTWPPLPPKTLTGRHGAPTITSAKPWPVCYCAHPSVFWRSIIPYGSISVGRRANIRTRSWPVDEVGSLVVGVFSSGPFFGFCGSFFGEVVGNGSGQSGN